MKENSISYKTAKQETERLIVELEERAITHRAFSAECLKRVLKENEELKIDNDIMKQDLNENVLYVDELEENYISVQKVKDKIEEYKKMLLSCNRFSDVDRIKAINERILELKELLEEVK